jgi:serine/threonine-protein kinase
LKPENVFLIRDAEIAVGERVKLLDFGIAKLVDGRVRKTTVGLILGTPLYMSPEQCEGREDLDAKVDVYALGVLLYELLAGRLPFIAESSAALMRQHIFKEPPPLGEAASGLPGDLVALVHAMLAKQADARPPMKQVATALQSTRLDSAAEPRTFLLSGPVVIRTERLGTGEEPKDAADLSAPAPVPGYAPTPQPTPAMVPVAAPRPRRGPTLAAGALGLAAIAVAVGMVRRADHHRAVLPPPPQVRAVRPPPPPVPAAPTSPAPPVVPATPPPPSPPPAALPPTETASAPTPPDPLPPSEAAPRKRQPTRPRPTPARAAGADAARSAAKPQPSAKDVVFR